MDELISEKSNPLDGKTRIFSLLKFTFPTILMMIFMGLYTTADTIIVSRYINTSALSAINIVTPVINIIVGMGSMLTSGSCAIIAKQMGENDEISASNTFTNIFFTCIILGLFIMIFGNLFLVNLIKILGSGEILLDYSKKYLRIILLFTPFTILQVYFQSIFILIGKPKLGMSISVISGILNILLDYLFIVHMNMGIAGSALGTGLGGLYVSFYGFVFFLFSNSHIKLKLSNFDYTSLLKSISNGSSELVSQSSMAITTFMFNVSMMESVGEIGVASITIIIYSQFLLTTLFIGFSIGISPIISYHYGGKNLNALKTVILNSLKLVLFASISLCIITAAFGDLIAKLYSYNNISVYLLAKRGLLIFSISFIFSGTNIFTSSMFTALSDGKTSAFLSMLRTLVFIVGFILILPIFIGVDGIFLAIPLAEILTFFVSIFFIRKSHLIN